MRQTGGGAASVGAAGRIRALRAPLDPAQIALPLALLGLLTAFILYPLYPLIQVLAVAFAADGLLSLVHLRNFFARPLFREALGGSLPAGFLAVLFGSLLGVPLAYFRVKTAAGVVRAGTFQGAAVRYEVLLGRGEPVRVNTATPKGQRLFPPGAEVAVCFDPADVILIPREDR